MKTILIAVLVVVAIILLWKKFGKGGCCKTDKKE